MRREPRPVLLAILLIAVFVTLALPASVAACSCAVPDDPMREAAGRPEATVFTGIIQRSQPVALPVAVTRWFKGPHAAPVVGLDARGFEDPMGGSCGTHAPPLGTEWLFVTARNERGLFDVHLCTTHADLGTDQGAELLASATEVFGPAEAPPQPASTPEATGEGTTPLGLAVSVLGAVAPLGVAVAFGIGLIGGLVLILRRREDQGR